MKNLVIVLFCFLLVTPLAFADQKPRIAVISAFGAELEKLKDLAEIEDEVVINGISFTLGRLEGDDVVMLLSGVSMVNAAMTTQLTLDHFSITHIVFSGIAGGVNPNLNIGDVTVPSRWSQYQESLFAKETGDGWDIGWHKAVYPNFYMSFPQPVKVTHSGLENPDDREPMIWFTVDQEMLEAAYDIQDKVELLSEVGDAKLGYAPKLVVGGNGVSGQTFVDNAEYRDYVYATFQADCLDMESSAVAHVAYCNQVPFLVFRSLSDLAGGGPGMNLIGTFFRLAADNAAEVLIEWLKVW